MAKPTADFVRSQTALIACLMSIALGGFSVADEGQSPALLPTTASSEFATDAASSSDMRLSAVEGKLDALLATKKQPEPVDAPTFKMGGQVQVDYLWIGQSAANRASVGEADD